MAATTITLTVPSANGAGAWVNASALSSQKTVLVTGSLIGTVTIEISNDSTPVDGVPVTSLQNSGAALVTAGALWMRARVDGYKSGTAVCGVTAPDGGVTGIELAVPAGNGAGASVASAVLGELKTITVIGTFRGAINIEASNDGGVTWSDIATFNSANVKVIAFSAELLRVQRTGVPVINPGTATVGIVGDNGSGSSSYVLAPTDDVAYMQAVTDAAYDAGYPLTMLAGNFDIDDTWYPKGTIICVEGVVIRPSLTWDVLLPNGQQRPYVWCNTDGLVIVGCLEIDARGDQRDVNNTSVGMLINDIDGADIEFLRFRNQGCSSVLSPGAGPSGPDLLLVSLDVLTDYYAGDVGACENVHISRTEHIKSAPVEQWFAVRFASDFATYRAKSAFVNHTRYCRIDQIDIRRDYSWNPCEMLGGGTTQCSVGRVSVLGKCLAAMDFDKGCYDCYAEHVELHDGGKPAVFSTYLISAPSTAVGAGSLTWAGPMVVNAYVGKVLADSAGHAYTITANTINQFSLTPIGTAPAVPTAGNFLVADALVFSTRWTCASIHGVEAAPPTYPTPYYTTGCWIGKLVARDCTSTSRDTYESCVYTQYTTNAEVQAVDVSNITNAVAQVAVVHHAAESVDTRIRHIRADQVPGLLSFDANASGYVDNVVEDVIATLFSGAVVAASSGGAASQTGLQLRDVLVKYTVATGAPLFAVSNAWANLVFDNVQVRGRAAGDALAIGFQLAAARGQLVGCKVSNLGFGFELQAGTYIADGCDVQNVTTPLSVLAGAGVKLIQAPQSNGWSSTLVAAALTGVAQNNYAPAGIEYATVLLVSATGATDITGLQAGYDGQKITIINTSTTNITLKEQNAGSTAANRFALGADKVLNGNGCTLTYTTSGARWALS